MRGNPVELAEGDHFLHIFIHEDGIRLDQFLVSPDKVQFEGGRPFQANVVPGRGTQWEHGSGPAVHLSYDLKSMVITPRLPPDCKLALRKWRGGEGTAVVRAILRGVGKGGDDLVILEEELDLAKLPELSLFELDFSELKLDELERREYLLRAELSSDGDLLASTHIPLMKPYQWQVFGPLEYVSNEEAGPLDADLEPEATADRKWAAFADTSWDHFGVMDFGLHTSGNSLYPPTDSTIYARTRIRVPRTDTYLLKLQADDQMLLWLDGELVYRHDDRRPVTRAAYTQRMRLEEGEHRLRVRVNQGYGRWQAAVRIRTMEDDVSGVVGVAAAE